jgi:CHAT domain-containing protein
MRTRTQHDPYNKVTARGTAIDPSHISSGSRGGGSTYSGAPNVLATLWPKGDRGAAVVAERLYAHLERLSPPEALAATQRVSLA